jgi:hypothetical protein
VSNYGTPRIPGLRGETGGTPAPRFGPVPQLGMGCRIFANLVRARLKVGIGWGFPDGLFGGYFQWVLDTVCETVEWLHQPLGFDSLALRAALDRPVLEF